MPDRYSTTIYHAKPVIIAGAWLSCETPEEIAQFKSQRDKMDALLGYWDRERLDAATGCYVWWDQMESGADDLPLTEVPSNHTPTWDPERDGLSLSAPDVMVFLHREHTAYSRFLVAWAGAVTEESDKEAYMAAAAAHGARADAIAGALNKHMWNEELGHYVAYNVKTKCQVGAPCCS